jgi:type IV pilus assembly protein PilB
MEEEGLLDCGIPRSEITLFKPVGCPACNKGYKGRVGVYEVVKITPRISRIIMEEGNSLQIAEAAKAEGFYDLRVSGLRKCAWGLTSLEEINRVTKD